MPENAMQMPGITVALAAIMALATGSVRAQPLTGEQIEQAHSLLTSHRLAMQGIRSGDVILQDEWSIDTAKLDRNGAPAGVLIRNTTRSRVLFDSDRGYFASLAISEQSETDFETLGDKGSPAERTEFKVWSFFHPRGSDTVFFTINGEHHNMDRKSFPEDEFEFLGGVGFPDPRGVISSGSGAPSAFRWAGAGEQVAAAFTSQVEIDSMSRSGNFVSIVSSRDSPDFAGRKVVSRETIDVETLMPVRTSFHLVDASDGIGSPNSMLLFATDLRWREIDGAVVPVMSTYDRPGPTEVNGRLINGRKAGSVRMEWLKVNGDCFPPALVADLKALGPEKIREMVENPPAPEVHRQ